MPVGSVVTAEAVTRQNKVGKAQSRAWPCPWALQSLREEGGRSQAVGQYTQDSERQHKPPQSPNHKTVLPLGVNPLVLRQMSQPAPSVGGSRGAAAHHPSPCAHLFTQDPAMPPLNTPSTWAPLGEACHRLGEEGKTPRQRCCMASPQQHRNHWAAVQAGAMPFSNLSLVPEDHKEPKKPAGVGVIQASQLLVTHFLC
ncbi:hypothetical protein P7K49_029384 [Saguinus oedipus]|uniref:Uncharacterized protein n=1 Tax=Saguinus oedipus TaxID=9490 RepID=A0ABQ9U713_SAGOE|nr:hypothetical protein P7K49_029384 [Saguinus oedipus]